MGLSFFKSKEEKKEEIDNREFFKHVMDKINRNESVAAVLVYDIYLLNKNDDIINNKIDLYQILLERAAEDRFSKKEKDIFNHVKKSFEWFEKNGEDFINDNFSEYLGFKVKVKFVNKSSEEEEEETCDDCGKSHPRVDLDEMFKPMDISDSKKNFDKFMNNIIGDPKGIYYLSISDMPTGSQNIGYEAADGGMMRPHHLFAIMIFALDKLKNVMGEDTAEKMNELLDHFAKKGMVGQQSDKERILH